MSAAADSSSSSSSKNRVSIFVNGTSDSGKLLVLSSGSSLKDILEKAAEKLSEGTASPLKFTRIFVESGAEVTNADDVMAGDKLYFSTGESFAAPATSSSQSDPVKYHFLSSLATSAAAQAASLYERSATAVKTHAPAVGKALEKVEGVASDLAQRYDISNRVVGIGSPLLAWADDHVDAAYDSLQKRRQSVNAFLQSPVADHVSATLFAPMRVRLLNGYSSLTEDFRVKSEEAFARVHQSVQAGKDRATDLKTHADGFITDMKTRLGTAWNDRLREPALSFYQVVSSEYETLVKKADASKIQLQQLFQSVRERLGKRWEESVAAAYDRYDAAYKTAFDLYMSKLREPAAAFYLKGFEAYSALQATSAQGKVSLQEFLAAMRVKIGSTLWSEALLEPARALFETFSNSDKAEAKTEAQPATSS